MLRDEILFDVESKAAESKLAAALLSGEDVEIINRIVCGQCERNVPFGDTCICIKTEV